MVDLIAKSAAHGLLPLEIGNVSLAEVEVGYLTSLSAYQGKEKDLSVALKTAHGMALPSANRATGKNGARAIWFGLGHVVLMGPAADTKLSKYAATTDQSDGWTIVELKGAGAADVLARLVPVDLRSAQFKRGHSIRTELMHMAASITCTGLDSYLIMVFRSMAKTLVHDLKTAMEGVASRG